MGFGFLFESFLKASVLITQSFDLSLQYYSILARESKSMDTKQTNPLFHLATFGSAYLPHPQHVLVRPLKMRIFQ
jgi:hypothetical protein